MFTHLHVHSYFSFHQGASSVERLVDRAAQLGMRALALTDTNGLYGAVPFYRRCRERGLKPILGAEIDDPHHRSHSAVLLARSRQGYAALCRVLTRRHLETDFSLLSALAEESGPYFLLVRSPRLLESLAAQGVEGLYGEVRASRDRREMERGGRLVRFCRHRGLPYVVTNDVHFARPAGYALHRLLRAIGLLKTIGSLDPEDLADPGCWLKSEEEMQKTLGCLPEAFTAVETLAEACHCELELGRFTFPKFPLAAGEEAPRRLRQLVDAGLAWRFPGGPDPARRQADYELSVIERLGFVDYFLVVHDLVEYARRSRIPLIGRGSAANSLVSYCLGITHVDPLAHHLFFERFLNPERKSPPDIDLDFGTSRRDGVLDWIYARYGRDRVAMISTTNRYSNRSAIREVGKAYGMTGEQIGDYTRRLPYMHVSRLELLKQKFPECRQMETDAEPYRSILRAADRLVEYPRHLSIHCGGVVITPEPLWNWVPLERAAKGFVITQMDMGPIEELGLVKIDILGNRSLDVLPDTLEALARQGKTVDVEHFARIFADPATCRMLEAGETMGCFYIESPAMRSLLRKLRVHDFEGLTAASSIIRPGVAESGMMRQYIERHHGIAEVAYLHPRLKELLGDTFGVMVYQEDVIRVAHYLAGMSLGEADLFRRAMSGKMRSREAMRQTKDRFFAACGRQGLTEALTAELYRQIASFAGYSFCKAHSASFALLSFQVAYLKAHYPAEFMAAVIANGGGFYGPWAYLSEARRLGLQVLPPDVNTSEIAWTGRERELRVGLQTIHGLSTEAMEGIIESRHRQGSFRSLPELLSRVRLESDEAQRLVFCGALDGFGLKRTQLMWQLAGCCDRRRRPVRGLFDAAETQPAPPDLPDYSPSEKLMAELESFHFTLSRHPLDFYTERMEREGVVTAAELERHAGKKVKVLGWRIASKPVLTKGKDGQESRLMKFLSLEDLTGTLEVTLFPDAYQRCASRLGGHGPFLVEGRVELEFGVPSVNAHTLENLHFPDLVTEYTEDTKALFFEKY